MSLDADKEALAAIGEKLKQLRKAGGYRSFESFAFDNNISSRYYWGAEKGRNLSLKYLLKILRIHNVTLRDFFSDLDI